MAKFQHKDGELREYIVTSVSQGFVEPEEVGIGSKSFRHETDLKMMPKRHAAEGVLDVDTLAGPDVAVEADTSTTSTVEHRIPSSKIKADEWKVFKIKTDGRCFWRSAAAEKVDGSLLDDLKSSMKLRAEVMAWSKE